MTQSITILAQSRHDLWAFIEARKLLELDYPVQVEFADGSPTIFYTPNDLYTLRCKLIVSI